MGSEAAAAAAVPVEISSDEEDDVMVPAAAAAAGKRKSPEGALDWAERMAEKMLAEEDFGASGESPIDPTAVQELLMSLMDVTGIGMGGDKDSAAVDKNSNSVRDGQDDDDDDDDCIILDGDPDKPVTVAKEEGPRRDAAEDELQIVAEKGEIACRDFPHSRHLCATLPFSTSSHASHCSMCHCYVCDSPAPCAFWGKGTTHTDHCHATEKDAKWKKLRQSSKNKSQPSPKRKSIPNFYQSSTTGASSQSSANVSLMRAASPKPRAPFPVPTVLAHNQQVDPSIMAPWMQGMGLMRAPSPKPRATIPTRSKSAPVAPPVYTPSKVNHLQPSAPNYVPMQPAKPHAFQTAQVPPGARVSAGAFQSYQPQPHSAAPIGSQGHQYRPLSSYPQPPPNLVVGTGVPLSRYTSVATQGTQYQQVPSEDARLKEALDNLARKLGVSDYSTNGPLGQQSASTPQSLHRSQIALAKARHQVQVKKSYVAATPQIRSSSGHNSSNRASGGTVLSSGSIQIQQPLRQINSQSSLTLSGTAPSNFLDGK